MGVADGTLGQWFKALARTALTQAQATFVDIAARAEIERARTELRLGNFADCDVLLASAAQRIDEPTAHPVLEAVVLSLRGQCWRARDPESTDQSLFASAVKRFQEVDYSLLTPRDQGDFGIALAALGNDKSARTQLEAAVEMDSAPPEVARELAGVYLRLNKPAKAEPLIEGALLALPADPQLHLLRARTLNARRHSDAAVATAYGQAARLFLYSDRPTDALRALEEADQLAIGVSTANGLRAEALRRLGRYEEAIALFDAAITEDGQNALLLVRRAASAAALGDWRQASADLGRGLDLAGNDVEVLLLAGETRREHGDFAGAQQLADAVLQQQPTNPRAVELAAATRFEAGALNDALALVQRSGVAIGTRPSLMRLRWRLALAAGDQDDALALLQQLDTQSVADVEDTYKYASFLVDDGRVMDALSVVDRGIERWPDALDLHLLRVEVRIKAEQFDAALSEIRQILQLHRDNPTAHLLHAAALVALPEPWSADRVAEALSALDRSTALAPGWAEPWWLRAQISAADENFAGARSAIKQVLSLDPLHHDAQHLALQLHLSSGDLDEAERQASMLLIQDPLDADNIAGMASVLHARRRDGEALTLLLRPSTDTSGPPARRVERIVQRATVRLALNQYAEAESDLAAAAEIEPGRADLWSQRSLVARLRNDIQAAREFSDRAVELAPEDLGAHVEQATVLLAAGQPQEAESLAVKMIARWPDDLQPRLLHAQALAESAPDHARALLDGLAEEFTADRDLTYVRARFELQEGDYDAALRAFGDIPEKARDADLFALRAETHRLMGKPGEAVADAVRCLDLAADHYEGLATLGLARLDSGDAAEAAKVFERAAEVYKADPLACARLGQAYTVLDRFDEALGLLDRAAVAVPSSSWVMCRLGDALIDAGLYVPGADIFGQVCANDETAAEAWAGLAWCLTYSDQPLLDEARMAYERAVEIDEDDTWSHTGLADILHLQGEREQAAAIYTQARSEALRRRTENPGYLSLAGWCAFRLNDLHSAARILFESTSGQQMTGSDHFDLAMVHACSGRISRAIRLYDRLIPLSDRDPQRRRGLLQVARLDLVHACKDFPDLATDLEIARVLGAMNDAIAIVPDPPVLRAVRNASAAPALDALRRRHNDPPAWQPSTS